MAASQSQPSSQPGPLGPMLASLRNQRQLAQKHVAMLADIDGSTLSRLESGERGVSREVLDRICDALGLTRQQRLEVLVAAGFLTDDAARLLSDDALSRLADLITDPRTAPGDAATLRQFVNLALAYAEARGYPSD